jgi:GAF domain-containing protein
VTWTHPTVDTSQQIRGFDLSSDPVRAAALTAARDSGSTTFSAPVNRQPDGAVAVFVVQALYRPGSKLETTAEREANVVGYITASVTGEALVARMLAEAGPDVLLQLADGDVPLASSTPAPTDGHRVTVTGGGRRWVITLQTGSPQHTNALGATLATLLAAAAIGVALQRNRRKTVALRRSAGAVQALGQLSEHLAAAESLDRMADAIASYAPQVVGARRVVLALDDPDQPGILLRRGSGGEVINGAHPLLEVRTTGSEVLVRDSGELRRRYPDAAAAYVARGSHALAAVPLRRAHDEVFGVIGLEWARRERFGTRTRDAITAVVELCQQNVLRVEAQERRRATAASFSRLGQRLSVIRTLDEIAEEVVTHAPRASGAPIVAIGFFNPSYTALALMRSPVDDEDDGAGVFADVVTDPVGPLTALLRLGRRVTFPSRAEIDKHDALREIVGPHVDRMNMFPLLDSTGTLTGLLVFVWANSERATVWNEPGRMLSIADLTAQTVERAQLYQRQHDLVLELQRRTLPDVPVIPGLSIAARYLPSSSALGLGGDWYEVQHVGEGLVGLVVGDVVGHGIEAIADMTEIRTAVSTLLRTDADLSRVVAASSALLAADGDDVVFATVVLMVIDLQTVGLRYVRAGHPPPLLRDARGAVTLLDGAGTTPIGVAGREAVVGETQLTVGSVVVAYTDGLVERRDESIDAGIERLRDALASCAECTDVEAIADLLIQSCLGDRPTDDDIALLVARVDAV